MKNEALNEEDVCIADFKNLEQIFCTYDQPIAQINEAKNEGIDSFINLFEQQPIKWKSLAIVAGLAAGQIIAGCLTFAMPGVGTTLISEGVGDLVTAVLGGINRNFTWGGYAQGKAISLTLSLATFGFGKAGASAGVIESIDQQAILLSKQ